MTKRKLKINDVGLMSTFRVVFSAMILFVFAALVPSFSENNGNEIKPDEMLVQAIKQEYNAFDTALAGKDLVKIMDYYHKDYLNDGRTKGDDEKSFKSLFDIAESVRVSRNIESIEISGDKIIVTDSGQINAVIKGSGKEVVSKWEKCVMVIIKTEDGHKAYGNQEKLGPVEKEDKANTSN